MSLRNLCAFGMEPKLPWVGRRVEVNRAQIALCSGGLVHLGVVFRPQPALPWEHRFLHAESCVRS
jgi:hypothetical protein